MPRLSATARKLIGSIGPGKSGPRIQDAVLATWILENRKLAMPARHKLGTELVAATIDLQRESRKELNDVVLQLCFAAAHLLEQQQTQTSGKAKTKKRS